MTTIGIETGLSDLDLTGNGNIVNKNADSSSPVVKIGWSVRAIKTLARPLPVTNEYGQPSPADVVVAQVESVGKHTRIYTEDRQYSRLYKGDEIIGVVGYRYATDAYHAPSIDPRRLQLLTNAGLCGTVQERHASAKAPTNLRLVGFLHNGKGAPVNLLKLLYRPRPLSLSVSMPVILVVGSGMNSGKTTVASCCAHALASRGRRVALLKLTGSVSHRDLYEFEATGAMYVRDFSSYGFPSTYLITEQQLTGLYQTMLADAMDAAPDVVVAEIADGIFQRETQMLIQSPIVSRMVAGVLLTADCGPSALALTNEISRLGYDNFAVSGKITNAPLFVEELRGRLNAPVIDCRSASFQLADQVLCWSRGGVNYPAPFGLKPQLALK